MTKKKFKPKLVDINKLSPEAAEALSAEIGSFIAYNLDEANDKCAKVLKILGLQTAVACQTMQKDIVKLKKLKKRKRKKRSEMDIKVSEIMQECSDKCNELLAIYGLQVQLSYDIRSIVKQEINNNL